jgi:hypothetical protein
VVRASANIAYSIIAKYFAPIFTLVAGLAAAPLEAGFRSPESLVRNVYAYDGSESPYDSLRSFMAQYRK